MQFLIDFFPVILFFIAYKLAGIYVATGIAIAAAAIQVGWSWWRHHHVQTMHWVTLALLVIFGGLTIALHDPIFIMWKPTLINWLFALALLITQFVGKRPLIQRLMGQAITLPAQIWRRLNLAWIGFFIVSGLVNLYVVYYGSGFFTARQALVNATGQTTFDLANCSTAFTGAVLELCQIAQHSEAIWVNFKLFGLLGMTIAFVIAQSFYLARYVQDDNNEPAAPASH